MVVRCSAVGKNAEQSYFDHMNRHCDLNKENNPDIFPDTLRAYRDHTSLVAKAPSIQKMSPTYLDTMSHGQLVTLIYPHPPTHAAITTLQVWMIKRKEMVTTTAENHLLWITYMFSC